MRTFVTVPKREGLARVHISALLTQVTDARFNPRSGFRSYYLNSGSELVTRMSPAVCPRKRGGGLNRLFRLDGGNELVTRRSLAVCLVKHDGRASRLFSINGNLGSGRVRNFRASLTLAALHNHTILSQRLETELSAAPESVPTDTEGHQTEEVTTLPACPSSAFVQPSGSCRKEEAPRP